MGATGSLLYYTKHTKPIGMALSEAWLLPDLPDSSVPSRISPCAEQEVVTTTAQRLLPDSTCSLSDSTKKTGEILEEKIIPYVFRFILTNLIFPSDWSFTEETRGIKLLVRK